MSDVDHRRGAEQSQGLGLHLQKHFRQKRCMKKLSLKTEPEMDAIQRVGALLTQTLETKRNCPRVTAVKKRFKCLNILLPQQTPQAGFAPQPYFYFITARWGAVPDTSFVLLCTAVVDIGASKNYIQAGKHHGRTDGLPEKESNQIKSNQGI